MHWNPPNFIKDKKAVQTKMRRDKSKEKALDNTGQNRIQYK